MALRTSSVSASDQTGFAEDEEESSVTGRLLKDQLAHGQRVNFEFSRLQFFSPWSPHSFLRRRDVSFAFTSCAGLTARNAASPGEAKKIRITFWFLKSCCSRRGLRWWWSATTNF